MLDFSDIEIRRETARIEQKELCERAGVHHQTYSKLKNRPGAQGATEQTLKKLKTALDALVAERMRNLKETTGEQANG
ncbi:helix-turn-helix transcriptional regulator [Mesorhizobium sp.]|uniref:helix-turn-helix domain-containing protein n=1 Tax=Mesorhizobium sp. TaxID=1871066 RepID=UPI00121AF336|nr:helix-turn-helix transcriptional regulator [Mesorhizobium sp.]TIL53797.1 MAG: helix-turn-helix transcriptional regulator [Mesorhizobium sp.]TIX61264.1 MAG: helix-turn-helix transcriptional regulator [Mesorhizobium sp.]